jgi:hypothetical protein
MLERADSCELPEPEADNPSCNFAGYTGTKRGLGLLFSRGQPARNATWARRSEAGILEDRTLDRKWLEEVTIGKDKYDLDFQQYAPCSDAKANRNILKSLVFQSSSRRCNTDVSMVDNKAMAQTYPGMKLQTDHVYEAQTLGNFFSWLARGTGTSVGTYSLASEEWVVEVLLGLPLPGQGTGNAYVMDTTPLGVGPKWNPATVFDAMVFGFGRSDGVGVGPFTKPRGESHLVLVQKEINFVKGTKWFAGKSPALNRGDTPTADRKMLRNNFGPFQYLQWTPTATGQTQKGPFPVIEPVWNKWMRVSNWIDLVCWSFDNQFANKWNTWPGAPTNNAGGNPSLRALYARYIEDTLVAIEHNAAAYALQAKDWYQDYYSSLRPDGTRTWSNSNGDDPAWFNSAFGNGGWATTTRARFPRPGSGRAGWSVFGATGNPSMTIKGDGTEMDIGAPARI